MKGDILMRNAEERYNFLAIGQAIKAARESKGMTREKAAEIVGIEPRHLMAVENQGQHPSFNVFWKLVTMLDISVDQYLFPDKPVEKSTRRRQLDTDLDGLNEKDYLVMRATAKGLNDAKSE